MAREHAPTRITWRKSSFSGGGGPGGGQCVETAALPGDRIAFRDSKAPAAGILHFPRATATTWLTTIKAGTFDHPA